MSQKVDLSSALVLGGSALLVVSLFLSWFGEGDETISAWSAFEALDLVLAALALGAAAIASGLLDERRPGTARWLPAVAGAAFVVVAVQLIDPPPAALDAGRELGAWLALLATAVMVAGAAMSVAQVSVVLDVHGRAPRRRVPVVDRRPGSDGPAPPGEAEPAKEPGPAREPARPGGRLLTDEPNASEDRTSVLEDDPAPSPRTPSAPAPAEDPDRTQTFDPFAHEDEPRERGGDGT